MSRLFPIITSGAKTHNNPGDEFIGLGTKWLIEEILGPVSWLRITKPEKEVPWEMHLKDILSARHILYAGMPQYNDYDDWCLWWDEQMWEDYIYKYNLNIISLAGGAGYPDAEMSVDSFIKKCLSSEKTKRIIKKREQNTSIFTTRDKYANSLLCALGIENTLLPCTAVFAGRYIPFNRNKEKDLCVLTLPGYNLIPDHYFQKNVSKEDSVRNQWLPIYESLRKEYKKIIVVCHSLSEYNIFRGYIPEEEIICSDYLSLLRIYSRAHTVVSSRLHGSIPSFGMNGTKVVNIMVDIRGYTAEQFDKIISLHYKDINPDIVLESCRKAFPSEESDFSNWIEQYKNLLIPILRS